MHHADNFDVLEFIDFVENENVERMPKMYIWVGKNPIEFYFLVVVSFY